MTTFVNAIKNREARTENGMKALASTSSACVDLFFKIGAMRGKDVIPQFVAAYNENPEVAVRIALWARDVRSGAGERKIFRDILSDLCDRDYDVARRVIDRVPDLGRWDDLFFTKGDLRSYAFTKIASAISEKNGLAAKWMPRKGENAVELRKFLGMTPKQYRKTLVNNTNVVETQMCQKNWDEINFNHVPSLAGARYKKAFNRHTEKYKIWTEALVSGDKSVKVNASAVYPYDVLKGLFGGYGYNTNSYSKAELDNIVAQWDALPNYVGDSNVLPMVDISGSMYSGIAGSTINPIDVSVSLGLYLADKNKGKFAGTYLTFSDNSKLVHVKGNILDKVKQMVTTDMGYSTNLHAAFDTILKTAKNGNVPQEEMPSMLLILSDMQFNQCTRFDDSAMQMIRRKYEEAGYNLPQVVFWNLNAADNVPVKMNEQGVALVSGFSPSIVKSVLAGDPTKFTPQGIMEQTIFNERYNF